MKILITSFPDQRNLRHIIIFRCANCKNVLLKTQVPFTENIEPETIAEVLCRLEDITSQLPHKCPECGMPIGEPKELKEKENEEMD